MSKMADRDIRTRNGEVPTELDATLRVGHDLDTLDILDSRIPLETRLHEFNRRVAECGAQGVCFNCGIHSNFSPSADGLTCVECGALGEEADEDWIAEA